MDSIASFVLAVITSSCGTEASPNEPATLDDAFCEPYASCSLVYDGFDVGLAILGLTGDCSTLDDHSLAEAVIVDRGHVVTDREQLARCAADLRACRIDSPHCELLLRGT